jgi:NHS family xanthosine MFS transporter
MPACPPENKSKGKSLITSLGLDAFKLFKQRKMSIFFIFSMLLGASLQITNTFGEPFLHDFANKFSQSFAVQHPSILMSVSQMSETLFILTIPFFLKRFGIKKVMLMSMFAWVFRFGLFGIGSPDGIGFVFLVLSMIIYGMAFDFFNISGSLFVEMEAKPEIRASAQGLFMIMTNGLGAFLGGTASGFVVDYFTQGGIRHWPSIWFTFSAYSLIIGVLFWILFKYKHNPNKIASVQH